MDTLFQHINIPAVARMLYNLTARYLFLICNYGKKKHFYEYPSDTLPFKKNIICLVKIPGNFITELHCMNIFQAYNILPEILNQCVFPSAVYAYHPASFKIKYYHWQFKKNRAWLFNR